MIRDMQGQWIFGGRSAWVSDIRRPHRFWDVFQVLRTKPWCKSWIWINSVEGLPVREVDSNECVRSWRIVGRYKSVAGKRVFWHDQGKSRTFFMRHGVSTPNSKSTGHLRAVGAFSPMINQGYWLEHWQWGLLMSVLIMVEPDWHHGLSLTKVNERAIPYLVRPKPYRRPPDAWLNLVWSTISLGTISQTAIKICRQHFIKIEKHGENQARIGQPRGGL